MFYYETKTKKKKERQYITIYDYLLKDIWIENMKQAIFMWWDKYIFVTSIEVTKDYDWMKTKEFKDIMKTKESKDDKNSKEVVEIQETKQITVLNEIKKMNPLSILNKDWTIDNTIWLEI